METINRIRETQNYSKGIKENVRRDLALLS
jgi:hypothetical protein